MTTHLPAELLLQIRQRIEAAVGLYFPQEHLCVLDRKIHLAARKLAFLDTTAFACWILSSPFATDQIRLLAGHLYVEETYFFRDSPVWETLRTTMLPPLIASREGTNQHLRLWSAACGTGEEAYALAITIDQAALPNRHDWKCVILATETHQEALRYAQGGIYSLWSFRETSPQIRSRYFHLMTNGQFKIRPDIKKMVTLAQANLLHATAIPHSGLMDVILFRSVFSYLTPDHVKRVLERFYHTLVEGGWLIVGPEESTYLTASPFVPVKEHGLIVYRRERRAARFLVLFSAEQPEAAAAPLQALPPKVLPFHPPAAPPALHRGPSFPLVGPASPTPPGQTPAVLTPLGAAAAASSQPERTYEHAHALYEQGHYEHAVSLLLPGCHAGGDAASPLPLSIQACALLARIYANQGQLTEAQQWCEQALHQEQSDPALHYLRATIFLEQERLPEAVHAFREALAVDPDFALAHFALGNLLERHSQYEEARHHLSRALPILQSTLPAGMDHRTRN